jgi:hypothetical protein
MKNPEITTRMPIAKIITVVKVPLLITITLYLLSTFGTEFQVIPQFTATGGTFFHQGIAAVGTEFLVIINRFAAFRTDFYQAIAALSAKL